MLGSRLSSMGIAHTTLFNFSWCAFGCATSLQSLPQAFRCSVDSSSMGGDHNLNQIQLGKFKQKNSRSLLTDQGIYNNITIFFDC